MNDDIDRTDWSAPDHDAERLGRDLVDPGVDFLEFVQVNDGVAATPLEFLR